MAASPYDNQPVSSWIGITNKLVGEYPISKPELLEIAILSWDKLWESVIGGQIKIIEVDLPATVIGYFFQKLFSHELAIRYPNKWTGEKLKTDKDLINLINPLFSTEMKSSGQLGYSLFGNRSYNQKSNTSNKTSKDKSGYYIALNFYKNKITLLRLGWIDQDDWIPQGASTGQAATLKKEVYKHKMVEIIGDYMNDSPIQLLNGVGDKTATKLKQENIITFNDIKTYDGTNTLILKIKNNNLDKLNSF